MEQTITINIPEGKKAVYNESTNTISFVNTAPVRSKSWEEFCTNHPNIENEFYIDSGSHIRHFKCKSLFRNIECANHLTTKEDAEGILALIQLTRLHDEWVGDWKPNYKDSSKIYCISNEVNKINVTYYIHIGKLLSFPTSHLAQEFLDCFEDLIEKAKRFI